MAISSPCVRNCCLSKQDVCLGCGRHVDEIMRWCDADDTEKLAILERARVRREEIKQINPHFQPD